MNMDGHGWGRGPHKRGWHGLPARAVRRLAGRNGCDAVLAQARRNRSKSPSIPPGQWPGGTGESPVPPGVTALHA